MMQVLYLLWHAILGLFCCLKVILSEKQSHSILDYIVFKPPLNETIKRGDVWNNATVEPLSNSPPV